MKKTILTAVGALVSLNAFASNVNVECSHEEYGSTNLSDRVCLSTLVFGYGEDNAPLIHRFEGCGIEAGDNLQVEENRVDYQLTEVNKDATLDGKKISILAEGVIAEGVIDEKIIRHKAYVYTQDDQTYIKIDPQAAVRCEK